MIPVFALQTLPGPVSSAPAWFGGGAGVAALIMAGLAIYRTRREVKESAATRAADAWGELVQALEARVKILTSEVVECHAARDKDRTRIAALEWDAARRDWLDNGGKEPDGPKPA